NWPASISIRPRRGSCFQSSGSSQFMRRRDALKTLGLASAFAGTKVPAYAAVNPNGSPGATRFTAAAKKNFLWMRPDIKKSAEIWKRDFAMIKASGVDAINAE